MLNADSRDYKHICAQFGVEDTDLILMKVEAKKREREQNKCLVGESVSWLIARYGQHALLDTSLLVLSNLLGHIKKRNKESVLNEWMRPFHR